MFHKITEYLEVSICLIVIYIAFHKIEVVSQVLIFFLLSNQVFINFRHTNVFFKSTYKEWKKLYQKENASEMKNRVNL